MKQIKLPFKPIGWTGDSDTKGTAYERHQDEIEHINNSAAEEGDEDENENDAGADTEARWLEESRGGHRERGRHSSPVRRHNPYPYTHVDPYRRVTTVEYSVAVIKEELRLGEAIQSEHRNDSRSERAGDSRSRHQSTDSTGKIRGRSRTPAQQHRPSPMSLSVGLSPQSFSRAPSLHTASNRGTSASDQHEQHDSLENDKDNDNGSTAPEHEILDSSKGGEEEPPSPSADARFTSGPSSNTDPPISGNDQERSNGKAKEKGHGKGGGKGHGSSGSGYGRGVEKTTKGLAWVRHRRKHG